MKRIENKAECCGCEACKQACPRNCIEMKQDEEGFFYPKVNLENCVDCGICIKVCPFNNYEVPANDVKEAFVIQSKNDTILKIVASGGAYASIAKHIIDVGGISYGASFVGGQIRHTRAENLLELEGHYSSKYVQSRMYDIFKKVREDLNNKKIVLFSGTGCQVVALKKLLNCNYDNLITIDLVCAGVSSPKILEEYTKELEKKHQSKISYINFKEKTYGYNSSTMKIQFNNGDIYSRSRLTDPMMKIFTSRVAHRPSCSNCAIKGVNRYSDITLFDSWSYSTLTRSKDNDKGHTNIIVHSIKGLDILNECKNSLYIENVPLDLAIELDGMNIIEQNSVSNKRDAFMYDYINTGMKEAINKHIPITPADIIKEQSKKYLYKLGILKTVKRISKL